MWSGRSQDQKRDLARAITEAVVNIAQAKPADTIVVFQDIPKEHWAQGGVIASDLEK
jgi:4-oxalocrotonate tautomerase